MPLDLMNDLRNLQVLEGLPDNMLVPLAVAASVVELPAGTVIFRQGDAAQTLYLLVSGQVGLELCTPGGGCKRILTVGDGELLGWSPALGQQRMTATARALTDVRAIVIDGQQLLAECEQNPRLGYEFMQRAALALAKRLSATRLQLLNVYGEQMAAAEQPVLAAASHP